MDLQKLLLWIALAFVTMLLWQAWQRDYGPQPPPVASMAAPHQPQTTQAAGDQPNVPNAGLETSASSQVVDVYTDVFHAVIDTRGGTLRRVELLKYPVSVEDKAPPFVLLDSSDQQLFIAQSGLQSPSGIAPDHYTVYESAATEYRLAAGEKELIVPLTWNSPEGIRITKSYHFKPSDYLMDVDFTVENRSGRPWSGLMYRQLQRTRPTAKSHFIYTYTGGVWYSPEERYQKYKFDEMEEANLSKTVANGWIAMIQHYFLASWIPTAEQANNFYSRVAEGGRYIIGAQGPLKEIAPGQTGTYGARLFVGPKLQDHLEEVAPGLDLAVDYGKLHFIAKPIFWLLETIHNLIGNWGWSIVILTLLIKLAFYKLSETSYRSMAHMRHLQPKLKALQERYADDKQKLQEAMMKMYREEKINPLGGCLPILVQIPVFISLYWVLLESVEMRQADFMLWINDLSSPDPYFVLPIIMGITMLIQHRLNPTPLDPVQAKVMMVLPVIFTFFFLWFPAGLVVYWVVNNTLSILQQWYITRFVVKS